MSFDQRGALHLTVYHCRPLLEREVARASSFSCVLSGNPNIFLSQILFVCPPLTGILSDADFGVASLPVEGRRRKKNSSASQWPSIFSEASHCQIM